MRRIASRAPWALLLLGGVAWAAGFYNLGGFWQGHGAITISPASITVGLNGSVYFTASGGSGSYTWSVSAGSGSISSSGQYTAPGTAGTATITVVDTVSDTASATVTIVANDEWTWMAGLSSAAAAGVFGTKGTPSTANHPSSRILSGNLMVDSKGNIWLYGGDGGGAWSDLWKYSVSSSTWTWMSGSSTAFAASNGTFGTKGTPSTGNIPPARFGHATAIDSSDNIWVYGGNPNTSGLMNDLWRYNTTTGAWTWMSGLSTTNATAAFGTKGTPSTGNTPGSLEYLTLWYSGNYVWLANGAGGAGAGTYYNAMWKFDPSALTWTWVAGPSAGGAPGGGGIFGTLGSPSTGNAPQRLDATGAYWVDSNGYLWEWGGNYSGTLGNALWRFNPSTNEWTWMTGSSSGAGTATAANVYGTKGTVSTGNTPSGREFATGFWDRYHGVAWLFGGLNGSGWSDLWKYDPTSNGWAWMSGPSTSASAGVYGTKGTPSTGNSPGARYEDGGVGDAAGNLWIFGGNNGGSMGDLWRYTP